MALRGRGYKTGSSLDSCKAFWHAKLPLAILRRTVMANGIAAKSAPAIFAIQRAIAFPFHNQPATFLKFVNGGICTFLKTFSVCRMSGLFFAGEDCGCFFKMS